MYAIFEKTLQTDKGKALLRKFNSAFDTQKMFSELLTYSLQSTHMSMKAASLLSYIISVRIGKDLPISLFYIG